MITRWDFKAKMIQIMAFKKYPEYFGRKKANSFDPSATPGDIRREDGTRVITEISYGVKYPNSFLDIYLPKEELRNQNGEKGSPVFIYFHGGGFLFGTKHSGDPIAKVSSGLGWFFNLFLERGIAVVSAGYAFAPKYRFPVQIEQVDQVLGFLTKHAGEYGLDMERFLLGGGSAGADMSEVYGLVLADEAYAAEFPFVPSVKKTSLKGLIIDEAALDLAHFENSSMDMMLGCWVGENNMQKGANAVRVNVPKHIRDSYCPTFVTGSNKDHFFADSARQLKEKLDGIGELCEMYIPEKELGEFDHGFMTEAGTAASDAAIQMCLGFVEKVLGEQAPDERKEQVSKT
ncbi:MAG: alpha/beta hydrolase [Lachnospiraceae bacterium]|nr:alpha/beta hydrolase [Lachnospiraceae bacterium]